MEVESQLPKQFDFIFVDGDHSFEGLKNDWQIVLRRLSPGGIVCLHDTSVPASEPYRRLGSSAFFDSQIGPHPDFEWIECCHTLNVLRRKKVA
jgi:predicted O-methyltransferase YrrM